MKINFPAECDYAHGYHKALIDVKNWFDSHSEAIKFNRLYNQKGITAILSVMEMNADSMQKYGEDTEFHFEMKDKKPRFWIDK